MTGTLQDYYDDSTQFMEERKKMIVGIMFLISVSENMKHEA